MGRWKDGAQCAVMLSFDVDAETLWMGGSLDGPFDPGRLSQGLYGARVAVPLILDVLRRRDLPATFFIPGWVAENHRKQLIAIVEQGHEVGHHGWVHEAISGLNRDEELQVLERGIAALVSLTGRAPTGYRSPGWDHTESTVGLLAANGFRYSSNLMSHFIPWVHPETSIVELPVSWTMDDAPFYLFGPGRFNRPIWPAEQALQVWLEEFRGIYRYGGLFSMTMHPQLSGRPGRIEVLERLIDEIQRYPDVWFATGSEIAEYWLQQGGEDDAIGASLSPTT